MMVLLIPHKLQVHVSNTYYKSLKRFVKIFWLTVSNICFQLSLPPLPLLPKSLHPVSSPETSELILDPSLLLTAIFDGSPSLTCYIFNISQIHPFLCMHRHFCLCSSITSNRSLLFMTVSVRAQPEKQNKYEVLQVTGLCPPPYCGSWINSPSKTVFISTTGASSPWGRCLRIEVQLWSKGMGSRWNPQAWAGSH